MTTKLTQAQASALFWARDRENGVVLTNTRTHSVLRRLGYVEGVIITEAGREALRRIETGEDTIA